MPQRQAAGVPVTFSGTRADAGTIKVSGPASSAAQEHRNGREFRRKFLRHQQIGNKQRQRALRLAPLCDKHIRDRAEIQRIGDQGIQGVRGNRDNPAPANYSRRPIDGSAGGFSGSTSINQLPRVFMIRLLYRFYRGPIASATSIAI